MSALTGAPGTEPGRTTADLRFCREQFDSIRNDVEDFAGMLTPSQLEWRPDASAWSIAECVEHLNDSTAQDVARLTGLIAVARAVSRGSLAPYRRHHSAPTLALHESPRQALAASTAALTPPIVDATTVTARFLGLNRSLVRIIDTAVDASADGPPHDTRLLLIDLVGHVLQLNALHHWRFILQARRVMERPGFPRH